MKETKLKNSSFFLNINEETIYFDITKVEDSFEIISYKEEGVDELNEDHWKIINYLKGYFAEYGIAPMVRKMTKESGYSLKEIYDLFPSGPAKGACKVAGLPKPTGCV